MAAYDSVTCGLAETRIRSGLDADYEYDDDDDDVQ